MIDRLLRFLTLLCLCNSDQFTVEAFQSIEKMKDAIRLESDQSDNEPEIIYVDEVSSAGDVLPNEVLEEMNVGQPSELVIMKDLLGINVFTYILAAAIAFFFTMNILLGPGWLGNSIGLEGTGTFEKVSDSLPDTIDLSNDDYLI